MAVRKEWEKETSKQLCFWHDCFVMVVCIGGASALCALLLPISSTDSHVPLIFVLAVLLTARYTKGYWFGLVTALLAVLGVNYVFTYPYFDLNFTITGYPLTFVCFLGVAVMTSTLTSQIRESERARMEGEREKMRSNLLRAISHDLRTPLTSISGVLNTLQENDENLTAEERCSLAADAKMDADWLINMVENLLSITRIGGDETPKLHKEPQAAEEVISEAVTRFRKMYPKQMVEVRIPEQLLMVPMDAMLIEQVIMNLLVNVALHGGSGVKVTLSLSWDKGYAKFSFDDNGKGFEAETLRRLMAGQSPHGQESRAEDTKRTMGIGLSVCKTIVNVHGGNLTVKNRPEGGASVAFTLPAEEEEIYGTEAEDSDC